MKLLIVRTSPNILNFKNYNSQEIGMARALILAGHTCDIVYYNGKNPDAEEKIPIGGDKFITMYHLNGYEILKNGIFPSLKKLIDNYDIVQVNDYDQYTSFKLYTSNRKVTMYHGPYYTPWNKGYNLRCKAVDAFLALHREKIKSVPCFAKSVLAEKFLREKGFENVSAVGVGLNILPENMEVEGEFYKSFIEKKGSSKCILYIGNVTPLRNIHFIIHTAKGVMETFKDSKLVIIGKGEEGYVKSCFDLICKLGIKDRVIYKESLPQNELPALYRQSDVFLLPTLYDIFGMVLLEAMYYGTVPLTTVNGGSSTMISNGANGYIMNAKSDDDVRQWSEKISEILRSSDNTVSKNAHNTIIENFTWEKIVPKLINQYQKM